MTTTSTASKSDVVLPHTETPLEVSLVDPVIHLTVPADNLTGLKLAGVLRSFELLLLLRAISPLGQLNDIHASKFKLFAQGGQIGERDRFEALTGVPRYDEFPSARYFDDMHGASSAWFEYWIWKEFAGREPTRLVDIQRGSYDFVFQAANLFIVLGLQDLSLVKDLAQWTSGALRDVVVAKFGTGHTISSGNEAKLRLSPELVESLRDFDDVTMREVRTKTKHEVFISLHRNPK